MPRTLLRRPAALGDVQTKATAIQGNRKSNGVPGHDKSINMGCIVVSREAAMSDLGSKSEDDNRDDGTGQHPIGPA